MTQENPKHPLEKPIKGKVPPQYRQIIKGIIERGQLLELLDFFIEEREMLGLPEKPQSAYSNPKALKELEAIIEALKYDREIGFNLKKKDYIY